MSELSLLFSISFLSSTLLPGGSEAYLSWLVLNSNQSIVTLLILASTGNTLGGFTNWIIGYLINYSFLKHYKRKLNTQDKSYQIANNWIAKWGIYTLLLSWLPLVGDLLCLLAGIYKLNWLKSILLILIGKTIRYTILVYTLTSF